MPLVRREQGQGHGHPSSPPALEDRYSQPKQIFWISSPYEWFLRDRLPRLLSLYFLTGPGQWKLSLLQLLLTSSPFSCTLNTAVPLTLQFSAVQKKQYRSDQIRTVIPYFCAQKQNKFHLKVLQCVSEGRQSTTNYMAGKEREEQ